MSNQPLARLITWLSNNGVSFNSTSDGAGNTTCSLHHGEYTITFYPDGSGNVASGRPRQIIGTFHMSQIELTGKPKTVLDSMIRQACQ